MDKKQRKSLRTELFKKLGPDYMKERAAIEHLYNADYDWVIREVKAGWSPGYISQVWGVRFNQTQQVCVECLANSVDMASWNTMITRLAPYDTTQLRKCLLAGMTPEVALAYISEQMPDTIFDAAIKFWSCRITPAPYRGEPWNITNWKKRREKILATYNNSKVKDPAQKYELMYLNYMIGDGMPKSTRILRLKHVDLKDYKSYKEVLEKKNSLTDSLIATSDFTSNEEIIKLSQQLYDINRIIEYCTEGMSYAHYVNDVFASVARSWGVPVEELTKPIPNGTIHYGSTDKPLRHYEGRRMFYCDTPRVEPNNTARIEELTGKIKNLSQHINSLSGRQTKLILELNKLLSNG